jgi:hypothetical protein
MTFGEWFESTLRGHNPTLTEAFQAGAKSRDEEVKDLRRQLSDAQTQIALLRDAINKYLPESDHYSDNGVQFYAELLEALAATEPKK